MRPKMFLYALCMIYTIMSISDAGAVPSEGHQMMASGPSAHMIEAVREVAMAKGNVVDAAVAAALTLAVTSQYFASLGGGGFALIKMGDKVEVLDFREVAPAATHPKYYLDKPAESTIRGGHAVAVPGVTAGLWAMHKKYGKLHWKKLFETPLRLAKNGVLVSGEWVRTTRKYRESFTPAGLKFFFKKEGQPLQAGERLKQVALAQALLELRNKGEAGFYDGAVARDLVDSIKNTGGVMTLEDLKNYKVRWLEPLTTDFNGYKLYLMPPPSSGGVVLKTAFALAEKMKLHLRPFMSVDELHLLGQILSRSFRGRRLLGDPDFHKNPIQFLTSRAHIDQLAATLRKGKIVDLEPLKRVPEESAQTTHFSILDKNGNAIAFTVTLNGNYGSGVVSERFGIALNNEMDDFTTRPEKPNQFGLIQGEGNEVQAGKRPLSSMSPTLVEKDGQIILSLGAPGGPRIISAVYQALYRHLTSGLDIDRAIQAGRLHHQFEPDKLFYDEFLFTPETVAALKKLGHKTEPTGYMGKVYMVRLNEGGVLQGAHDSRGEGASGGL